MLDLPLNNIINKKEIATIGLNESIENFYILLY